MKKNLKRGLHGNLKLIVLPHGDFEHTGEDALDQMLWPVVHDAADLLTSEELDRGRTMCGRPVWLALPRHEPERSRRWCSMEDCGNQAKARRYYKRKRATSSRETSGDVTER